MKMKKSKLLSLLLVLAMLTTTLVMPVTAHAATTTLDKQTITLYPATNKYVSNKTDLSMVSGKATNLKSSKTSIATVSMKYNAASDFTTIYATAKKVGTTTISYKIKSKTYKFTLAVKKYTNPISSIKIGNTTISGTKFNKTTNVNLSYNKFSGKKSKVTINMKKGWGIFSRTFVVYPKGVKAPTYILNGNTITVEGGKGYTIVVKNISNNTTHQSETVVVTFK